MARAWGIEYEWAIVSVSPTIFISSILHQFFFNICKHLVDMLYISHTLAHEKIGFHVFPNNHAKKDGTTQNNYCFHYFLLEFCFISPGTV